ncbi:hypothetical protein [Roseicyclus persicicus]|uniref:Uncharacterized protein n=1 Tax=Roseicyclus persicicus TaxID=2650661 RepID=A0A7X6GX10_9RHOB|nr:hypothetical protein [Roseibacterium persicicum]NKX43878.1 hypothetical protein [Roseibacterium persicicum]
MSARRLAGAALLALIPAAAAAQDTPTLRDAVAAGEPPAYIGMRCAGFFAGGLAAFGDDLPEDLRTRTSNFVALLVVTTVATLEEGGLDRPTAEAQVTDGLVQWTGFYEAHMRATPNLDADPLYAADSADCISIVSG